MVNPYYNVTGTPGQGSPGASAPMRGEFANIAAAFAMLPALTPGTAIVVNGAGTGLTNTVGTLALGAAFATTGGFGTTLIEQASTSLTLPATSDTLVGRATTDILTNKTLTSPAITGATITNSSVNGITFAGTAATTMTFPTTSATIARTDAANTFTGTQTIGVLVATTVNGNTFTAGTGVLTIAAGKTLTASNSITLAGTDATVMTFPATSATIARTDAANTFTGTQTVDALTSTGVAKAAQLWQSSRNATYLTLTGNPILNITSGTMGGIGSSWKITPSFSGRVRIVATSTHFSNTASATLLAQINYGTGTAPVASAAATGTQIGTSQEATIVGANSTQNIMIYGEATGLTLGTPYWFDFQITCGGSIIVTKCTLLVEEF